MAGFELAEGRGDRGDRTPGRLNQRPLRPELKAHGADVLVHLSGPEATDHRLIQSPARAGPDEGGQVRIDLRQDLNGVRTEVAVEGGLEDRTVDVCPDDRLRFG